MQERQRILIVEDDYLVSVFLSEVLEAAGWQVVGPVGHLAEALDTAASGDFDAAVLDVNLGGQAVDPVAEVLAARRIPFVFVTGYGPAALPRPYCERPRLGKPFKPAQLIGTVAYLLGPAADGRRVAPPSPRATGSSPAPDRRGCDWPLKVGGR